MRQGHFFREHIGHRNALDFLALFDPRGFARGDIAQQGDAFVLGNQRPQQDKLAFLHRRLGRRGWRRRWRRAAEGAENRARRSFGKSLFQREQGKFGLNRIIHARCRCRFRHGQGRVDAPPPVQLHPNRAGEGKISQPPADYLRSPRLQPCAHHFFAPSTA